ncbi:glycosyl hydrolases family 18-domain-containing protein [Obelidium mucronatum]|nr:glycosyl hydrolases family 18-domain-containing protein [Obelidium mucronatum]
MPPQVVLALVLFASLISAAAQSNGRIIAAYVSDWSGFKANAINYTIVTNVHYCFANLDASGNVIVPSGLTADFIDTVHKNGAVISLTIGGWGTTPFSRVFSTSAGIANATNSISKVMTQLGLDGVEIDWEFPGAAGAVGTMFDTAMDSSNYLIFLKALRAKLGTKAIISACGIITTFIGSNGLPLVSTTEFAKVLSFISIMAYDINGAWNTYSGPNAPLQPDSSGKNAGSVVSGINNWVKSGFPLNQIVLATAFYGRGTIVSASMENNDGTNVAALVSPAYKSRDSSYTYIKVLRFLQDTTGYYVSKYDSITQTPWLYHKPTMEFISYENPLSISVKSQYAGCLGLLGISCWDISLDGAVAILDRNQYTKRNRLPCEISGHQEASFGDRSSSTGRPIRSNYSLWDNLGGRQLQLQHILQQ